MSIFHVWSSDRSRRYIVAAGSVKQLKKLGCKKLHLEFDESKIVEERSGSLLEDGDSEVFRRMNGRTFLLLDKSEAWTPSESHYASAIEDYVSIPLPANLSPGTKRRRVDPNKVTRGSQLQEKSMTEEHRTMLRSRLQKLVNNTNQEIVLNDRFLTKLSLTSADMEKIKKKSSQQKQTDHLLKVLYHFPDEKFLDLVNIFTETDHTYVSNVIRIKVAVTKGVDTNSIVLDEKSLKEFNYDIFEYFEPLLHQMMESKADNLVKNCSTFCLLTQHQQTLVNVLKECSMFVIVCQSPDSLQDLKQSCSDGKFAEALRDDINKGRLSRKLSLKTFEISVSVDDDDYLRCRQSFKKLIAPVDDGESERVLPVEIMEILLVKAYLYVNNYRRKTASYHKFDAYKTISSVCRYWRYVINNRKWFKRTVKRLEQHNQMSDEHVELLIKNKLFLLDEYEVDRVLEYLESKKVLCTEETREVKNSGFGHLDFDGILQKMEKLEKSRANVTVQIFMERTRSKRKVVECLLVKLMAKDDRAFTVFARSLRKTNQGESAARLVMKPDHVFLLEVYWDRLVQETENPNGIIDLLFHSNVLSSSARMTLRSLEPSTVKMGRLLTIVRGRPDKMFVALVDALRNTKHQYLASLLGGNSNMTFQHKEVIRTHADDLYSIVNPNSLITKLKSKNIVELSSVQKIKLASKMTPQRKMKYLLKMLLILPDTAFDALVLVVQDAKQLNLAKQMKAQIDFGMTLEHREILARQHELLLENMNPHPVWTKLITTGTLTSENLTEIKTKNTRKEQVECLLGILLRKSDSAFMSLFDALIDTEQPHLANLLNQELTRSRNIPTLTKIHKAKLQKINSQLVKAIDHEIMEDVCQSLMGSGALTLEEVDDILVGKCRREQVERLMNIFATKPEGIFKAFEDVLGDTNHPILRKLFSKNANSASKDFDSRGANKKSITSMSDKHVNLLERNHNQLLEELEPKAVRKRMLANGSLSFGDVEEIRSKVTRQEQAACLLNILRKKPDGAFIQFVHALQDTERDDLARCLIDGSVSDDERSAWATSQSMTEEHKYLIHRNYDKIVENTDPVCVWKNLTANAILTFPEVEEIKRKGTRMDQVEGLLDMIIKKPDNAFMALVRALKDTSQPHVARLIYED